MQISDEVPLKLATFSKFKFCEINWNCSEKFAQYVKNAEEKNNYNTLQVSLAN